MNYENHFEDFGYLPEDPLTNLLQEFDLEKDFGGEQIRGVVSDDGIKDLTTLDVDPANQLVFEDITATNDEIPSPYMFFGMPPSPLTSNSSATTVTCEGNADLDDSACQTLSPTEVFMKCPRKRGRRPKSAAGLYYPPPKPKKQPKVRIYQIAKPFKDKDCERKRLNAINAKRHRDLERKSVEAIREQVKQVTLERDNLMTTLEELKMKETKLQQKVDSFKAMALNLMDTV